MDTQEIIIIGSGPAGLTAGIYTGRAELNPLIIGGLEFGGQLMGTTLVENFPGFPDGVMGPELMENMLKQAQNHGADIKFENVSRVDFSSDEVKKIYVGDKEYLAKSVIIATGSSPRKLGLESEEAFWGKGVSSCATCDGAFYKDRVVAVIGGGDSAMEEATFLTKFAKKVYVVHRRDELRASKAMQKRAFDNPKIEFVWNAEVRDIVGDQVVKALKIYDKKEDKEFSLEVDGMFLAIGHIPNTDFLKGQVELDDQGYIVVTGNTRTSVDGIFVAGDVKDHVYRQAITASGMGAMAAIDAEKWLAEQE